MRRSKALFIVAWLLGGCAFTPPLPPECTGKLAPINGATVEAQQETKREARP